MNNLIKWDPLKELADIQGHLSFLFTRNHNGNALDEDTTVISTADWTPAVDLTEDDDAYEIAADLPDGDKVESPRTTVISPLLVSTRKRRRTRGRNITEWNAATESMSAHSAVRTMWERTRSRRDSAIAFSN